jgi:hypothetical protein
VFKRLLLWSGLFCCGVCTGFLLAWVMNAPRTHSNTPEPTSRSRESVTITLSATIDGSDRFVFTRDHVWNDHGKWDLPKKVLFNGAPWEDLSQAPPGWPELAEALDLRKAAIVTRDGRDFVSLERTAEGFDIYFADTLMGSGQYMVTISIPRK